MKKGVLEIKTVYQCNSCLGCKTLHPLVGVIDLSEANPEQPTIKFDFYTILLTEGQAGEFMYGRTSYDYSNASLRFSTPGKTIKIDKNEMRYRNGWLLAFHPDLFCHTPLCESMKEYTFFMYGPNEALHLSLREKIKATECLSNIREELQHDIDYHSKTIISRYIQLFLDYCSRFYERQFITRNEANKIILNKIDILFDEYVRSGLLRNKILPSAEYFSKHLHLSAEYLNDLLKFETGKTITGYFQLKRIEISKVMLLEGDVKETADMLGFSSVQHFSRLFKLTTGITPNEYKAAQN